MCWPVYLSKTDKMNTVLELKMVSKAKVVVD